jgi:hypothetical protein
MPPDDEIQGKGRKKRMIINPNLNKIYLQFAYKQSLAILLIYFEGAAD